MEFLPLKTVVSAFQASLSAVPEASCGFAVADLKVELPAEVAVIGGEVMVKLASSAEPVNPAVLTKVSFTLGATCTPETAPTPVSPWTAVSSGAAESLNGAWSDATSAWVVGDGGKVLSSSNSGTSFSSVDVGTTARFFTVSQIAGVVVVAGELGKALFREPGAAGWQQSSVAGTADIHSLLTLGTLVVAVGSHGSILVSSTKGQTFDTIPPFTQNDLHSVVVTPDGILWAAGAHGTVLISNDVKIWKPLTALVQQNWYAAASMQNGRVFVAGESGKMALYSLNGGQLVDSGTTKDLYSVHVMESGAVLAAGQDGTVVWSKDGVSFTPITSPTTQSFRAITPLGGGKLLFAGASGALFRLDTTLL